jgi:hypothetical protein
MEYFAGLDVSMKETHVCVVDRDGDIVLETSTATLPEARGQRIQLCSGSKRAVRGSSAAHLALAATRRPGTTTRTNFSSEH